MLALCTHQRIYHHTPSCTWYSKPRVGSLSVQVRDKKLETSYRAVQRHTHTHTQHPAAQSLYPRAPVKCRSTFNDVAFVHKAYIAQKLYESMANHGARNMLVFNHQYCLTRNDAARMVCVQPCFTHDKVAYACAKKIVHALYRGIHTTVAFNATVGRS